MGLHGLLGNGAGASGITAERRLFEINEQWLCVAGIQGAARPTGSPSL